MIRSPNEWEAALRRHKAICAGSDLRHAVQITHGRYFWPLEPNHPGNDIDIETIAHITAGIPRWASVMTDPYSGGPCSYSVAQHLVLTSQIVERSHAEIVPGWDWSLSADPSLHALMHDAQEAYLMDLVRPLKSAFTQYGPIEHALQAAIYAAFAVPTDTGINECVRRVDNMLIFLERDLLVGKPCLPYGNEADHPRCTMFDVVPDFRVWCANEAKAAFLDRFEELSVRAGRAIGEAA